MGIRKGDRVAIYMPMIPEAIASMLACNRIGAVHVVIFGGIGAQSVKDRILDAEAKLLVTVDGSVRGEKLVVYKSKLDAVLEECPTLQTTLVFENAGAELSLKPGRDYLYRDVVQGVSEECPPEQMGAEDPLFILHTSGTTGKPKGILHTTGGYLVGVHSTFKWVFDLKPSDIYWSTADIGWITGHSFVVYGPLSHGVTQVIYEGAFDYPAKNQFAKIIDEHKVTIFYTAPTFIRMLMQWGEKCWKGAHLDSLRLLGSIGEPINPNAWRWFYKAIGHEKCPIVDTWFQTETGALVISPIPGYTPLIPGSVTNALPGYKVAILDGEGNPAKKGFLAIMQPYPSMMRGVYKDHDRYVATYWKQWNGKYYFCGDFAEQDDNGHFWVEGRCDEVLKISGHRIGTTEIENALIEDSSVAEAAVIGVKDALKGQKIVAFVVLKNGASRHGKEKERLKAVVADYVGSYARPDEIEVVDDLPKTRSGKILRRILKSLVEGDPVGNTATLYNPSCLFQLTEKCEELGYKLYPAKRLDFQLNQISARPIFEELNVEPLRASSKAIVQIVQPFLENHLENTNYDRLHLVAQFLDFYSERCLEDPSLKLVDALVKFTPDMRVHPWHGSSCHGLIDDVYNLLPGHLGAKKIPAILGSRFAQEGWSKYSHTALVIRFASPCDPEDAGYILLDPNFDISEPIVILDNQRSVTVDMKTKGLWSFSLEGSTIVAQRQNEGSSWRTVFMLKEYLNPQAVAVKPMIAADRRLALVARDKHGVQQGSINVRLDLEEIQWVKGLERQPPISFANFIEKKDHFKDDFADFFHFSATHLNELILNLVQNRSLLDDLRRQYFDSLTESTRKEDFFIFN
jgi:acetyl-CoA synthetase